MYKDYSDFIKETLNLDLYPVGVKFFENKDEIGGKLEKTSKNPHCQLIINAGKGGEFYGTVDEIGCPIGSSVLGLKDIPDDLSSGERFEKMKVCSSKESGAKLFSQVSKMDNNIEAISYGCLGDISFKPDVIVIIGKSRQIFNFIRANAFLDGENVVTSIGGTQSLCGDIVADSYLNNKSNLSFGCIGSHLATEFSDTDVVFGFPESKLEGIVESLKTIKIII